MIAVTTSVWNGLMTGDVHRGEYHGLSWSETDNVKKIYARIHRPHGEILYDDEVMVNRNLSANNVGVWNRKQTAKTVGYDQKWNNRSHAYCEPVAVQAVVNNDVMSGVNDAPMVDQTVKQMLVKYVRDGDDQTWMVIHVDARPTFGDFFFLLQQKTGSVL